MALRDGFRLAGMRAELGYLAKERFTGEVQYWIDAAGSELRRTVREVHSPENGNAADTDCGSRLLAFAESLAEWCERPQTKMLVKFTRGYIKRIEREW